MTMVPERNSVIHAHELPDEWRCAWVELCTVGRHGALASSWNGRGGAPHRR